MFSILTLSQLEATGDYVICTIQNTGTCKTSVIAMKESIILFHLSKL